MFGLFAPDLRPIDLFSSTGAGWLQFFLALRRRRPPRSGPRPGQLVTCPRPRCGRLFIRTVEDPRVEQLCQTCEQDRKDTPATGPIADVCNNPPRPLCAGSREEDPLDGFLRRR
jgi:hypothetical protein